MRCLSLLLLILASSAQAADYSAQAGSTLGFTASYQGEAFNGSFGKFVPQIRFDPAKLADSRFDVRITLASANTQNSERDDCHLCDLAWELLAAAGITDFDPLWIDGDAGLEARYGTRVPVLRNETSGEEIDWPFDAAAVARIT